MPLLAKFQLLPNTILTSPLSIPLYVYIGSVRAIGRRRKKKEQIKRNMYKERRKEGNRRN